jgi:hypothetical protein
MVRDRARAGATDEMLMEGIVKDTPLEASTSDAPRLT